MREIELQFNFQNVSPELHTQIKEAIDKNEPFLLTNGRVRNLFVPTTLQHYHQKFIYGPARITYENIEAFYNGILLALLSCKEFVSAKNLPSYYSERKLTMPLTLEYGS